MIIPQQCLCCRFFQDDKPGWTCSAFPGGIPQDILEMNFDHRNPHAGDHGIRWQPDKPGTKHPIDTWPKPNQ